jgi:hypothetical protein
MLGMVDYKRRLAVGDFWGFDRVAFLPAALWWMGLLGVAFS